MRQIQVKEITTPESLVMKRIAQNLGLNLRPEKAAFNSSANTWTIPMKAIIPSQVTTRGKPIKTFIYRFGNVAKAELTKENNEFKFLQFPKAPEIDNELHMHWTDLTQKLVQEILKVGEPVWGQLTYVQMFLRPLYSIILHTLTNRKLSFSEVRKQEQEKYVQFLLKRGYLEEDLNEGVYKASNHLTALEHHLYEKYKDEKLLSDFFVTGQVIGTIFAKYYNDLKIELRVFAPSIYVDTSTAYYIDAIRAGASILMSEMELWKKARMIGHRSTTSVKTISYPTVISEIVAGKIFARDHEGFICANESVFNRLNPLEVELAQEISEI